MPPGVAADVRRRTKMEMADRINRMDRIISANNNSAFTRGRMKFMG